MTDIHPHTHSHIFLGEGHEKNERRTWMVIWLCSLMMIAEIVGGILFGSIALVADGLHMSTHALLLAALAYTYARKHADDGRFTFGTGKLGDLAGFTSAVILAMIALLIAYEAISRLFSPVPISFNEVIPIAFVGLAVNVASAWLLSGGSHHHGHGHHSHGHDHDFDTYRINALGKILILTIYEDGVPPRFRLRAESRTTVLSAGTIIETVRPDGARQEFKMVERDGYLESLDEIPEPHAFKASVAIGKGDRRREYPIAFEEHQYNEAMHRDNNMRAAVIHVIADAAVSVLVITGLLFARFKGWLWMDPLAGIVGSLVIASWSYGLIRDTGAILLDMNPDREMAERVRTTIEADGDRLTDLHLWRLGPGHLGAILSVATAKRRGPEHYRRLLDQFHNLSHVTVEVLQAEIRAS